MSFKVELDRRPGMKKEREEDRIIEKARF